MRRQLVLVSLGFRRLFLLSAMPSTPRRASAFVSCLSRERTWGSNPDVNIDLLQLQVFGGIRPYSRHQEAVGVEWFARPSKPNMFDPVSWPAIPRIPNARKLISRAQFLS